MSDPLLEQFLAENPAVPPMGDINADVQLEAQKQPEPAADPETGLPPPPSFARSVDPNQYDTNLSPDEEQQFQAWKSKFAPNDSGQDYDLRGGFKSGLTPAENGHWPDTFKKPNHPTFSDQSVYAQDRPDLAGSWDGEKYVPPSGLLTRLTPPTAVDQFEDAHNQDVMEQYLKESEADTRAAIRQKAIDDLNQRSEGDRQDLTWAKLFGLNMIAQDGKQIPARAGEKAAGLVAEPGSYPKAAFGLASDIFHDPENFWEHYKQRVGETPMGAVAKGIASKGWQALKDYQQAQSQNAVDLLSNPLSVDAWEKLLELHVKSTAEATAGAARTVASMGLVLPDATSAAAQVMLEPPITALGGEDAAQKFDATLNTLTGEFHHWLNLAQNKVEDATGIDKESAPYQAGSLAGMALAPELGSAKLGPAIAKGVEAVDAGGAKLIGTGIKAAAGASGATARGLARLIPGVLSGGAAHMIGAGPTVETIATALGLGYGWKAKLGEGIARVVSKPFDKMVKFGQIVSDSSEEVGTTISKMAQKSIQADLADNAALIDRVSAELGSDSVKKVGDLAPSGKPLYPDELLKPDERQLRKLLQTAEDLKRKHAFWAKLEDTNKIFNYANRFGMNTAAHGALGGAIGAGFAGVSSPPGDVESTRAGAVELGMIGGLFAPIGAHAGMKGARFQRGFKALTERGAGVLDPNSLAGLHPKDQASILELAGALDVYGKKVSIVTPEEYQKMLSPEKKEGQPAAPEAAAPVRNAPWAHITPEGDVVINSEAIKTGVGAHEFRHVMQKATGQMLEKSDPTFMQAFEEEYGDRLKKNAGETGFNAQAERDAEVGRIVLSKTPLSMFYGGAEGIDVLARIRDNFARRFMKKWFNSPEVAKGEGGHLDVPRSRADMANMREQLLKFGEEAASKKRSQGSEPSAPESGMPVVLPAGSIPPPQPAQAGPKDISEAELAAIENALKPMGVTDPRAKIEAALQELRDEGVKPTLEEIAKRALRRVTPKPLEQKGIPEVAEKPVSEPETNVPAVTGSEQGAPAVEPVSAPNDLKAKLAEANKAAAPAMRRARSPERRAEIARDARVEVLQLELPKEGEDLHAVEDPITGQVTYKGRIDPANPVHQALFEEFGYSPEQIKVLTDLQNNQGRGVYLRRYNSAAQEGFEEGGADYSAHQRKKEYGASKPGELGEREGEVTEQDKAVTPLGSVVTKKGVNALVFDHGKFLNNVRAILDAAHDAGIETGYEGLTGAKLDDELAADVRAVAANHAAGYDGTGSKRLEVFPDMEAPNKKGTVSPVDARRAAVINAAFANQSARPPKPIKENKSGKPVADLTKKQHQKMVDMSKEAMGLADLNQGYNNKGETNALRDELVAKGFDPSVLKPTISQIRPDLVAGGVHPKPSAEADVVHAHGFDIPAHELTREGLPRKEFVAAGFHPGGDAGKKGMPKVMPEKKRDANFKKWTGGAPVVPLETSHYFIPAGPIVVEAVHGTTHNFNTFDPSKGSIESDWGRGIYLSNTTEDVASNYAGEGPDLTNRIERLADQIQDRDWEGDYPDEVVSTWWNKQAHGTPWDRLAESARKQVRENYNLEHRDDVGIDHDAAIQLAKKELTEHQGATMKVYAKFENPLHLGTENEPYWDIHYPEEGDMGYDESTGLMADFIRHVREISSRYDEPDPEAALEEFSYDGGKASEVIKSAKNGLGGRDENNDVASNEIIRQAIERMGYDGIVDATVDKKFGSQRRTGPSMQGMHPDTIHYIAFKPEQIKSATGNRGTFDPNNPDITFHPGDRLREEPERAKEFRGGFPDIYGPEAAASKFPEVAPETADLQGRSVKDAAHDYVEQYDRAQQNRRSLGDFLRGELAKLDDDLSLTDKARSFAKETVRDYIDDLETIGKLPRNVRQPIYRADYDRKQYTDYAAGGVVALDAVEKGLAKLGLKRDAFNPPMPPREDIIPRNYHPGADHQTESTEFKKWFGDVEKFKGKTGGVWADDGKTVSKVVDKDGNPLRVYHGSKAAGFTVFETGKNSKVDDAYFFTNDLHGARSYSGTRKSADLNTMDLETGDFEPHPGVYEAYLNIRNPFERDMEGANWDGTRHDQWHVIDPAMEDEPIYTEDGRQHLSHDEAVDLSKKHSGSEVVESGPDFETTDSIVRDAQDWGHDGVIIRNVTDSGSLGDHWEPMDVYVAFKPEQIKSADENQGTFDPSDPDIRFHPGAGEREESDLPRTTIHTNLKSLKGHPDYAAAKGGDNDAAGRVISDMVKPERIAAMAEKHPDAIVAYPHAEEEAGRNKLPVNLAAQFAQHGLTVEPDIVQTNRVHHTGKGAMYRLQSRPGFNGPVEKGRKYILVDDATTSGSTFAAMRDYIEERGGKVVDTMTMATTFSPLTGYSGDIGLLPSTRAKLAKFDQAELNSILRDNGIAPSADRLSNAQAAYIASFKSLESLRDRIVAERLESGVAPSHQPVAEKALRGDSRSALEGAQPPQSGFVRLYRGEQKDQGGVWFSDNPEVAEFHFFNHSDEGPSTLSYIDVPEADAEKYASAAYDHPDVVAGRHGTIVEAGDHVLPPELAAKAKVMREAEPNAEFFHPGAGESEKESEPFYSQLTRTIKGLPQETMTVGQARAAIEKGAKKDEIGMSGILTDPLSPLHGKEPNEKVSKADLTGYTLERQAKVQDVTFGGDRSISSQLRHYVTGFEYGPKLKNLPKTAAEWRGIAEKLQNEAAGYQRQGINQRVTLAGKRYDEMADEALRVANTESNGQVAIADDTHFQQYQLPGGDEGSYREMFVTWSGNFDPSKVKIERKRNSVTQGTVALTYEGVTRHLADDGPIETNYQRPESELIAMARKIFGNKWADGHLQYKDVANPIVRIRRNIRTNPDGTKTYFIEEMQGPGPGNQEEMPPELRKRIYEIGMKRALRDAAAEGADAIAWTTGEQQAERYDLSKHISRIVSTKLDDDHYEIITYAADEPNHEADNRIVPTNELAEFIGKDMAQKIVDETPDDGEKEFGVGKHVLAGYLDESDSWRLSIDTGRGYGGSERIVPDAELPSVVGEEMAEQIRAETGDHVMAGERVYHEESDLKVGGEGLKRVYDKMLPSIANQVGKKFGAKVGEGKIDASDGALDTVHSMPIPEELRQHQMTEGNAIFHPGGNPIEEKMIKEVPAPRPVQTLRTGALPLWYVPERRDSLTRNALKVPGHRAGAYERLDQAKEWLSSNPAAMGDPKGFVEFMRRVGVYGKVPQAPLGIGQMVTRPDRYAELIAGGYHGPRTVPGTMEAAKQGLDGVMEMRNLIGGPGRSPPPFVTALHSLWGLLSRTQPPLRQEAMWLRMINNPDVLQAIEASIKGDFDMPLEDWAHSPDNGYSGIVGDVTRENADGGIGNSAIANANAFWAMLTNWNGNWDKVSKVYAAPNATQMRRRFWDLDMGPSGIKNKVQGFVGLSLGMPGSVLDRWKYVEFWLPNLLKATGAATPRDYFKYSGTSAIPEDPLATYGNLFVPTEDKSLLYSTALYEGIDHALSAAIASSKDLQQLLGDHANTGGLHWYGWNAIKNEAVGHSSLDLTKDLMRRFGRDIDAQKVQDVIRENSYFTEGSETQRNNARISLDRGRISVDRSPVGGSVSGGQLGRPAAAGERAAGFPALRENAQAPQAGIPEVSYHPGDVGPMPNADSEPWVHRYFELLKKEYPDGGLVATGKLSDAEELEMDGLHQRAEKEFGSYDAFLKAHGHKAHASFEDFHQARVAPPPNEKRIGGDFHPGASDAPRAVKGPALRLPNRAVISVSGPDAQHFHAVNEIDKTYGPKEADALLAGAESGWVTNNKEFLDNDAAEARAIEMGQVTKADLDEAKEYFGTKQGPLEGGSGLESLAFNRVRKLPKNVRARQDRPGIPNVAPSEKEILGMPELVP